MKTKTRKKNGTGKWAKANNKVPKKLKEPIEVASPVVFKLGRPPEYKTVEELERAIESYFASCEVIDEETGRTKIVTPYTLSGLAYHIGIHRDTLMNYEKKELFFGTIQKAKNLIKKFAEEQLYTNQRTAGVIFSMINTFHGEFTNKSEVQNDLNIHYHGFGKLDDPEKL